MEIFSNIENLIILYAPTALMFIAQIIDWAVTLKKFKKLKIEKQIEPLLIKTNSLVSETKRYKAEADELRKENKELLEFVKDNIKATADVNKELAEIKECLKNLSKENVELKAKLRRKETCAVKEQENV